MAFFSYKIEPGASQRERCTLHADAFSCNVALLATKIPPKGARMDPKGPNLAQNGAERGPENIEKSMPGKRSATGRLPSIGGVPLSRIFGRKGRPGDRFWRPFWNHFPSKMRSKIDAEIESQKNMKHHEKSMNKSCEKY